MARLKDARSAKLNADSSVIREAVTLRHDLHRHPELSNLEVRTSAEVARRLTAWGYDVATGIGGHGVVGSLRRGKGTKSIGIRADMDALPITEASGLSFASSHHGVMHACGHDGHTAILLAAARHLAEAGRFSGALNLIFQPAEEAGGGARKMIDDGLFERFPCDAVYGLHNWPNVPAGTFGFVDGPAMAAVDFLAINVVGKGGHGAAPHETVDPVLVAAHLVTALQSVVSRTVNPLDSAVVTVGAIHGGGAPNVIPDSVALKVSVRTFRTEVREAVNRRIKDLARGLAASFGARTEIAHIQGYPSVLNHSAETQLVRQVALDLFGADHVDADFAPRMASEDFAYFLEARPGSFVFVGTGPGEPLHSPRYQFNDDIIAPAASLWAGLVEAYLQ